jgi:sigma-B regulation protein RsbU (phosphoserine phosphatase)
MKDRLAFLEKTDLLTQVPDTVLERICAHMKEISANAGDIIFRDGDVGDGVYFIVEGTLRIEKDGIRLVSRRPPECVGEFALIDESPRSAAVVAETDAKLLKWERRDFLDSLSQSQEVVNGILRILTRKLRQDVSLQVQAGLERERLLQDLKRAHEIQMSMLPHDDLYTEHMQAFGHCHPAAEVGGDYYDYLPLEDDKLGLIIGDVMGHGFYSGLLVPMAKSCLHTQAMFDYSPDKVMQALNRTVSFSIESGLLMTCCYVLVDPRNGLLTYCNAGHPHPCHFRRDTGVLHRLGSTDLLLGVPGFAESTFSTDQGRWERGDLLVLFSDGISEATDPDGEEFGEERLQQVIMTYQDEPPARVKDRILEALSRHCRGSSQSDDITVVVAKAV